MLHHQEWKQLVVSLVIILIQTETFIEHMFLHHQELLSNTLQQGFPNNVEYLVVAGGGGGGMDINGGGGGGAGGFSFYQDIHYLTVLHFQSTFTCISRIYCCCWCWWWWVDPELVTGNGGNPSVLWTNIVSVLVVVVVVELLVQIWTDGRWFWWWWRYGILAGTNCPASTGTFTKSRLPDVEILVVE